MITSRYPMLAETLQSLRLNAHMSIGEVSTLAMLSKSSVHELESGANENPTLATLAALAHVYGVTLSELVGEEPIPKARMTPDQARVVEAVLKALPR